MSSDKPRVVIDLSQAFEGNEPNEPFWTAMTRGADTTQWADRFSEYMSVEEHEICMKELEKEVLAEHQAAVDMYSKKEELNLKLLAYEKALEYFATWHTQAKDVLARFENDQK